MYTTLKYLGKRVIQKNPSNFDERLFSDIYLCRLRLKQGREIYEREVERGRERGREGVVERERERERENSNSKTLFYKDCSLGSVKNLSNN